MTITMLPNHTEMINEQSTCEEAAAFLANCLGESIAIEYKSKSHQDASKNTGRGRTFLVKLVSVTLARQENSNHYHVDLYVEGREFSINSKYAFSIKKCMPSTGHIF